MSCYKNKTMRVHDETIVSQVKTNIYFLTEDIVLKTTVNNNHGLQFGS